MTQPTIPSHLISRGLILLLLALGIYFFRGFLVPALVALIIVIACWPLYLRLKKRCHNRRNLPAVIAMLIFVAVLIVPFSLVIAYSVNELKILGVWLKELSQSGIHLPTWIASLPWVGDSISDYWLENFSEHGAFNDWVQLISGEHFNNIYRFLIVTTGGVTHFMLLLLFVLLILFFLFRDGDRVIKQLDLVGLHLFPAYWYRFSRVIPETVSATVSGMGIIAIGEGIILGVAYWIAGVSSAIILGLVTAFMALVPGGAPLSFISVSLYLVVTDRVSAGIGLFIWGCVELFIVDKTIRPRLIGAPVQLPFLFTFFGLIGGLQTMGLLGIFVGPVLMALLLSGWREWQKSLKYI